MNKGHQVMNQISNDIGAIYGKGTAPLHVVGENALDVTSALSVTPEAHRGVPDFVGVFDDINF